MDEVLVATWDDGVFVVGEGTREHELAGLPVRGLTADGRGGALAIVGGHTLRRRGRGGAWQTLAASERELSCCVARHDRVYVGTDDARLLCLTAAGELVVLAGFDGVEGRETWFAGTALVDGQLLGPPLGVRSICATAGGVLLVNVHVGGIPRSADGGVSWRPTIAIGSDVHEVRAHPERPEIVAAASAMGLCLSTDGGVTWSVEQDGLHAAYCSAVAFVKDDVLVSAAADHFAPRGRVYRRAFAPRSRPRAVGGLPEWTEGIVDTQCLAASGSRVACADASGKVYVSRDEGASWSVRAYGRASASSLCFVG